MQGSEVKNRKMSIYKIQMNKHGVKYLAAAASRFFAFPAPGSTDKDLAANSSLLEAIEMFFKFPITCI